MIPIWLLKTYAQRPNGKFAWNQMPGKVIAPKDYRDMEVSSRINTYVIRCCGFMGTFKECIAPHGTHEGRF